MRTQILHFNDLDINKITYINYLSTKGATNENSRQRMKKILSKAIFSELTEKQRYCIIEHYINERKGKDIAFELGVNASTVSRHISSAKRKLKHIALYYI